MLMKLKLNSPGVYSGGLLYTPTFDLPRATWWDRSQTSIDALSLALIL